MKYSALTTVVCTLLVAMLGVTPARGQTLDEPVIEKQTDNLTLVDHIYYEVGSDMQFQRRRGPHLRAGERTRGTRDYLFAGADAFAPGGPLDRPTDGVGIHVFDITDPTAITPVAGVHCVGYHSDVAVYENVLVQTIDDADSNGGCDPSEDPEGIDERGHAGLRIFDVSDPARPKLVRFIAEDELDGASGVHNSTVVGWAGLLYLATNSGSRFGYVDLEDPEFPVTMIPMDELAPSGTDARACHDIGLDPDRRLAFCAAANHTFIWDISEPTMPEHVATIDNPDIEFHHGARLAPDGETLVLNDEAGLAVAAFGCLGEGGGGTAGALWFYDVSHPSKPGLKGSFSTEELNPAKNFCTSHFYNFIPGTQLLVVGWYRSGMIVVDYSDPSSPKEHAAFLPMGAHYWSAYYWHGALYGNAFEAPVTADGSGGLWVLTLDGVGDVSPAAQDEGTSWGRWSPRQRKQAPEEKGSPLEPEAEALRAAGDPPMLPTGGGVATGLAGLVLLGFASAVGGRRRCS